MNTLVVYAGRHGATRTYAERLAASLAGPVTVVDLKQNPKVDVTAFDQVVVGSAIYTGMVQKEVKEFCARNLAQLKQKRLGLFICCLFDAQQGDQQLQQAFPAELQAAARVVERLSGSINLAALNFIERQMTKMVGVKENRSGYSDDAVQRFVDRLQAAS